ncbi:hypothetical protein I7I53_07188 [Histoplasma capsulatum var. duboisii H88]|uniref:Uncharacterized protein n=1 Tax=Ajellomyces capsulatus (strain H88) TaxID=544711 RepID=A0A8A1LIZ5_AJEC8|nr:hypothetical protein I7I53_07188 [Histoplasma capsulatum var. duboisii H88]
MLRHDSYHNQHCSVSWLLARTAGLWASDLSNIPGTCTSSCRKQQSLSSEIVVLGTENAIRHTHTP